MIRTPTFEDAIGFARDLIRIPSPPGGEGEVAQRVMEEMRALGFDDVRRDPLGSVLGRIPGAGSAPSVVLCSHMDVVDVGDPNEWQHPPYSGDISDGCLHGRGAMDIKGPLALQTYTAAALRGKAAGDVLVAFTVFEERGGWGMRRLMESGELRPGAIVVGEATGGDIAIGHRGRMEVEVVLHGRAGHASAPRRADNALDLLPPALMGVRDAAASQPSDPVLGPATIVPTQVETLPSSRNVIPDRVILALDCRLLPGQDPDTLLADLRSRISHHWGGDPGSRLEVRVAETELVAYTGERSRWRFHTPGFLRSSEDPLVRAAAAAVGRRAGAGPARVRPWGFATDGGWSCGEFGIPSLGFAPGEEALAHTNRERLDLGEARWCWERYPGLVVALQEALARAQE